MKLWIGPIGGALITGAYGMFRLADEWAMGDERPFQASGTLLAYIIVGALIGFLINGIRFLAAQPEPSRSDSLSDETNSSTTQRLLQGGNVKLLDPAWDIKRRCEVSHALPDNTKVQRIRPQIEALQRALDAELSFVDILHVLSDARSAINDLSAELVGDYVRMHVSTAQHGATDQTQTVQELVDAMRSCLK